MLEKNNPRKVDFSNGCVDIFNFKKGEHNYAVFLCILTYYIENTSSYYVSNFQSFLVWNLDYIITVHTLGQNEKFCNLPLTWPLQKKRLRKMQLGIILISQGGRIVFFDECSMYIFVEDFFFGWVCLFLRIEKSMKQKGGRKKKLCTKIPAANVLRNLIFEVTYLFSGPLVWSKILHFDFQ